MAKLYAQPYSLSARGFYFSSPEGFAQKAARNIDPGTGIEVEEYEIQFIDGDPEDAALFQAIQSKNFINVEQWYDIETMDDDEKASLAYLVGDLGYSLDDAFDRVDDVRMFKGGPTEYAMELTDDIGIDNIVNPDFYFDYESFGRDLAIDMDPDDEADAYYLSLSDRERGEEFVDSMGGLGELGKQSEWYFDYEALGRDLRLGGDIHEFSFAGTDYVVTNAGEF